MTLRTVTRPAERLGIFAINLDRSPGRWAAIRKGFGDLTWPLHRVPALDANSVPDAVLAFRGQELRLPPSGVDWNPLRFRAFSLVEEACFCSHLLALRQFLGSGCETGLILEDDAEPRPQLAAFLSEFATAPQFPAFDILKLEGTAREGGRLTQSLVTLGSSNVVRSLRPSSGAAGYLVTRSAAERLLKNAGRLCVPYDDYLSSPTLSGCRVVHTSPWLIVQSGAKSTMRRDRRPHRQTKRRDPWHTVLQGFRRGLLRLAVWRDAIDSSPLNLFRLRYAPWVDDSPIA